MGSSGVGNSFDRQRGSLLKSNPGGASGAGGFSSRSWGMVGLTLVRCSASIPRAGDSSQSLPLPSGFLVGGTRPLLRPLGLHLEGIFVFVHQRPIGVEALDPVAMAPAPFARLGFVCREELEYRPRS